MTTGEGLLAAVLASPEDDLPRLVYADWLDENGEPERAEFIRSQIADPHGGQYSADAFLVRRFRPHAGDVSFIPDPVTLVVRRGFVVEVHCSLADWIGTECRAVDRETQNVCAGGRVTAPNPQFTRECRTCKGTGQVTEGIGPAIVRRHPVTRVEVTDVEPVGLSRGGWEYPVSDHPRPNRSAVPWDVFDLFSESNTPTADQARAVLSAAMLLWAKSQPAPSHPHQGYHQ